MRLAGCKPSKISALGNTLGIVYLIYLSRCKCKRFNV